MPLPPPASTTDVYLAAVIERLDALLAAFTPATVAPTQRATRKRG